MTDKYDGHTPGPWAWMVDGNLHGNDTKDEILDAYIDEDGRAYINACYDADVELIAAAPDLLAENKRLREALEAIKPLAGRLRLWGATGDDVWQIVTQALATHEEQEKIDE